MNRKNFAALISAPEIVDLPPVSSPVLYKRSWLPATALLFSGLISGGCSDAGPTLVNVDDQRAPIVPEQPPSDGQTQGSPNNDLTVPADLFQRDGYDTLDVERVDISIGSAAGPCNSADQTGCTFADVNADTNGRDEFTVDIPVHFQSSSYANDGTVSNATLRQRGASSRQYPQKSYRIKLDKEATQWRSEDRLQLNKHPADLSRLRNKLSFDLIHAVPDLPSLRTQFVNLWIDEGQGPVDYGLFTHVEDTNKDFLKNRNWNVNDKIYKAETFAFSANDLVAMQLDATGAPLNPELFEERLSVENGDNNHTRLIEMITAVNDSSQNFDDVLERYFDRDNVLAWVTVNFLLAQKDVIAHNFFIYNPVNSEKFYFLPWDYDAAFYIELDIANSYDNDALRERLMYGYARGANSAFLSRYFRLPGINAAIVSTANDLRTGALSNSAISKRVTQYVDAIRPYLIRQPDLQNLSTGNPDPVAAFDAQVSQLAGYVSTNYQALQDGLGIPMPPTLALPAIRDNLVDFSWSPAYDVTGSSISYDIQVATNQTFSADVIVLDVAGIADDASNVVFSVPASTLPAGILFYRVIARASSDPQKNWQIASNVYKLDGTDWFGIEAFELVQ